MILHQDNVGETITIIVINVPTQLRWASCQLYHVRAYDPDNRSRDKTSDPAVSDNCWSCALTRLFYDSVAS